MKTAALVLIFLAAGVVLTALAQVAQVPQGTQLQKTSLTVYRDTPEGKKLDFVITGTSVSNVNSKNLVQQFEMKRFRDGNPNQIQIIAQAPECAVDLNNSTESDKGPLQIFTPTTNLYVQGVGFQFTQSNHFLIISNEVQARVERSLLKSSSMLTSKGSADAGIGYIFIFADHGWFSLDSNVVDYAGRVHMIDPRLDLTSDFLTIHFTTNGAVQSMLACQNVVLTTTNNDQATGVNGFYYVTNGNEMMVLSTNAAWHNGDREAHAQKFIYDSSRHFLTCSGAVQVRWPNVETNSPAGQPVTNGFRELYSDFATVQFPPTNGPVESMHARGNVIIVNEADQSRAMAGEADYQRAADRVVLTTDNPVWWNNDTEVKGDTLSAVLSSNLYYAHNNAHFKRRTGGAASHATNQWIFISSDDIEYRTNRAVFYDNVEARLVENNMLRDTLNCDLLTLKLISNQVESAYASGDVHGKTAPDKAGVVKTIACRQLNGYVSPTTHLMTHIDAFTNVVITDTGSGPAAPSNTLTADFVTAKFSAVTNRIEQAIAERNVVLDQIKAGRDVHATSEHAVYTDANGTVRLTGSPLAHTDNYLIKESDFMVWLPKANTFQAFGRYKIVPIKPAAAQKAF